MANKEQKPIDKQRKAFMLTINNPIENGGYNHERIIELIQRACQLKCVSSFFRPFPQLSAV